MIEFIKSFEGFSPNIVKDVGQFAIGYGTACKADEYPDGITEEEADYLMRKVVLQLEEAVTRYLNKHGINLSGNQFDALISLSYNLGTVWINDSNRICAILKGGAGNYNENDIASSIGIFCHIGSVASDSLLARRIREVKVFLYGDYSGESSPNFNYVIFNGNGGTVETDVRLYKTGDTYQSFPSATAAGSLLSGWQTQNGVRLQTTDVVRSNQRVKALWTTAPASTQENQIFTDVSSTDWFSSYVNSLHDSNVIRGYSDHTFRPSHTITVGETLKLVLVAIGLSEQPKGTTHWAQPYADLALRYGFLSKEDLTDGLNAPAKRIMIAKLAARALDLRRSSAHSPFADTNDDYVVALYNEHIIDGVVDTKTGLRMYYPDSPIKRSEIAKIVWLLYATVRSSG